MSLFKTNISKVLKAFNQEVVSPKLDLKANKTYVDGELSKKANTSHGTHVTYSTNAPLSNGTASAGSAATVARTDHVHPLQTTISGNAGTATKLQTARTISLTGDVEGSTAFDGSSNKSISTVVNKLSRKDISGSTININDYTLASGSPKVALYVVHTNGGSQNITNIPVTGNPFILDVELVRWVSSSDYITKQTFVSSSTKSTYVRWCTDGTWSGWTTEGRMTTTPTSGQIVVADGNTGGIKTSGFTIATSVPSGAKFTDTVYTHPNDSNTRHVTDSEKSTWNAKETTTGAQQKADAALASAKSYTDIKVASFVDSAPETLDTLNELATALGNDPNFATTVSNKIGTKADTTYVNQELGKKANTSHNQAANTITAMTGYSKPSSTSAIATTDSLNAAIGKLEKALDGKQASGSYAASSHTHNYAGSSSAGGAANSANTLATARTINGTSFNGSANITTANWGTARTITIGNTGKSVNGSANISWTLSEIGAASSSHNHDSVYTKISNNAYGTGKFNSTTGVTISIGKTMSSTGYKVNITPTSNPGGSLGEFWVESKTTTSFVVKCSGSTTTTTFDWTVSI